jgi:tetratricopeptide (TPR) repeat protein
MRPPQRFTFCVLTAVWLTALCPGRVVAAPFVPTSDAQVLERLPSRSTDPRARELQDLRTAWRNQPQDIGASVNLARAYYNAVAAEGDPRYIGYAQAALAPWWTLAEPPTDVRVLRAVLRQFDHRFDEALVDLDAAIATQPNNFEAWSWRAAIYMVQANYPQARRSCEALAPLTSALIAAACAAQVDATTGRTAEAAATLRKALQVASTSSATAPKAQAAQRLWVLTRLAETEERRGAYAEAEAAFREAMALNVNDIYLQAAYADFLLDQGRAAEVPALLKDRGRADVLLLRQALAAQALGAPDATALARELGARFDAARLRGDTTHRKEESRYVRAFGGAAGTANALKLATENFAEQREPADARILLEAAIAAKQPTAAEPVLQWMAKSGIASAALTKLAAQLTALPGAKS